MIGHSVLTKIGERPSTAVVVRTADGREFDLGKVLEGNDLIARFYQWRQRRRVDAYCKAQLAYLTGEKRAEFKVQVDKMKEARRG